MSTRQPQTRKRPPASPQEGGKPVPTAKKRAPGRPKGAAPVSRDHLFDAALACFVRRGIAATSLRDIATEAKVTPALLHYYFGDKGMLVEALAAERMLPALQSVGARVQAAGDDIAATVAGFVCGVTEVMKQNPWWPQLWVREVLSEGGALRDLLIKHAAPGVARLIAKRFADAQSRGELNPDLDPRLLMTSLVGLTLFPAAGAPIWRRVFDADDLDLDDVRTHAIALLDRGLELKS
jgi:AcrR family transcriptional regulator